MANCTSVDMVGAFLVLGSAIWYAGYIMISDWYVHHAGPWVSTIIALGVFHAWIQPVGPATASILSTLEPVFTVLLIIILLSEKLRHNQFIGGASILAEVISLTMVEPHKTKIDSWFRFKMIYMKINIFNGLNPYRNQINQTLERFSLFLLIVRC